MHKLVLIAALTAAGFGAESANYDATRQGQLPAGWSAESSHEWEVRSDKTAPSHPNVLQGAPAVSGQAAPLVVFNNVTCKDGDLSVKFRIDGRQHGNAAGIVWRYQDPNNYYLLTLNADDKTIILHRVRNGASEVIASSKHPGSDVEEIRPGQWHVVKVAFRGSRVQVFFGNRILFTADDSGILAAGKTGLWTKGSGGAAFDDFRIDKKG